MPLAANTGLMMQLQEKSIAISQLNRFADELRQELVFNRVTNANAVKELKLLSSQLSEKNAEIDELRSHIAQKDEADARIRNELNRQLETKDQEMRQLRTAIGKRINERTVMPAGSTGAEIRAIRDARTETFAQELTDAREQISEKNREIEELRKRLSARPFAAQKDEITKPANREIQYSRAYREIASKLDEKEREIAWLRQNIAAKDRKKGSSEEALTKHMAEKEEEIYRLRQQITGNEASGIKIVRELQNSIDEKEGLIEKLKVFIGEKKELQTRAVRALRQQLAEMEEQAEQLKHENAEIEAKNAKLFQQAENATAKITIKDNSIRRLSSQMESAEAQNKELQKQMEQLRTRKAPKLDIKAVFEANNKKHEERIKEIIKQYAEREIAHKAENDRLNSKIVEQKELLAQKQEKIDDAISEFAINAERLLGMREGEKIETGTTKKEAERLKQKEDVLNGRERRVQELLEEIKRRADEIKKDEEATAAREGALETKEALLLKEQEALDKEFEILEKAGFELKRSRDYLAGKREEIEQEEYTAQRRKKSPPAEKPASPVEIKTLLKIRGITPPEKPAEKAIIKPELPVFEEEERTEAKTPQLIVKTVKPEQTNIPKKDAEPLRPARALQTDKQKHMEEAQEMFSGQREGYSEADEIVSLIEIALATGDKKEKVMASLQASGYKKEDIDKALAKMAVK